MRTNRSVRSGTPLRTGTGTDPLYPHSFRGGTPVRRRCVRALTSPAARSRCSLRVCPCFASALLMPGCCLYPAKTADAFYSRERGAGLCVWSESGLTARDSARHQNAADRGTDASFCARRAAADPAVRKGWHTVWPLYSRCCSSPFTLFC